MLKDVRLPQAALLAVLLVALAACGHKVTTPTVAPSASAHASPPKVSIDPEVAALATFKAHAARYEAKGWACFPYRSGDGYCLNNGTGHCANSHSWCLEYVGFTGCSSLYAVSNVLDASGAVVGSANAFQPNVPANVPVYLSMIDVVDLPNVHLDVPMLQCRT